MAFTCVPLHFKHWLYKDRYGNPRVLLIMVICKLRCMRTGLSPGIIRSRSCYVRPRSNLKTNIADLNYHFCGMTKTGSWNHHPWLSVDLRPRPYLSTDIADALSRDEWHLLIDGEHFFIDADTKLHKVAPADWKERSKKGHRQLATFVTYFRVKYYISDLTLMRHVLHFYVLSSNLPDACFPPSCNVTCHNVSILGKNFT